MSSRAGSRLFSSARFARSSFAQRFGGRRTQATDATAAAAPPAQGLLGRMWNSPVGIKTVHFWAPVMKWSIVIAGISDLARPAEKLSLTQNLAITATGIIWTRWCFIIKPKNMLLATVNFFLACVGVVQTSRILMWRQSQKDVTSMEGKAEEVVAKVESGVGEVEGKVKEAAK